MIAPAMRRAPRQARLRNRVAVFGAHEADRILSGGVNQKAERRPPNRQADTRQPRGLRPGGPAGALMAGSVVQDALLIDAF